MARTNLLSAILGGVGGGVESGLAQRERSLAEEERRRAAEIAEQERQRVAAAATRAEARQGQLDIASLADRGYVTPEQQTQSMRRAAPGLQEALGVASGMMGQGPPRAMSEAGRRALESAAGQYGAPVAEVTVGGQTMRRMETPAQQALREANATSARTAREEDAKRRREAQEKKAEFEEDVTDAMDAFGWDRAKAADYVRRGGKSPFLPMTAEERDASARGWEGLAIQKDRAQSAASGAGSGQTSAMQQMMQARVEVAKQQSRVAHGEMEKFEEGLIDGSVKPITSTQATAAARAFGGTLDSKYWEGYLNKNRPDLAQYIRNAKAIGAAERLVMPRGGSNLLMNLETALAGVGPGASESLIRTTQAFRRGLVEGLERETSEALLEAENARVESAIGTDEERRGASPTGVGPRRFTDADRADRWDELRRQNPALSDDEITARVRREMP